MASSVPEVRVENFMPNICSTLGEGPHWDEYTGELVFVNIRVGTVYRLNTTTKEHKKVVPGDYMSLVIPSEGGGYIVTQSRKLCHLDWETEKLTDIAEIPLVAKDNKINDGKCDSRGRLWFGSLGYLGEDGKLVTEKGYLFKLEKGKLTEETGPFSGSNGIAWSLDDTIMYFVDSMPDRKLYAFDYDIEKGAVSNRRVLVDFTKWTVEEAGYPDGICGDENGNLWVAGYGAGKVMQFDVDTGKMMRSIPIPTQNVASCCFGGKDYSELYVTTAIEKSNPQGGSVFRVTGLGVKGRPAYGYIP